MRLRVGTSGYAYKAWKGSFYPRDLPAKDMLRFYGERLPAVEINNTFYRLPRAEVLASWGEQVPEGFRFALKASRRITHFARLKEAAADPTAYLLQVSASLGDRLGVLLFQLPPNLKKDLPRLVAFLGQIPRGTRAAFEFRHPSWHAADVFDALHQRDCALVVVDAAGADPAPLVATASYGYLRLRRDDYTAADLARWAERVRGQDWEEAFVFFKHEDAGAGPALAGAFLEAARGTRGARSRRSRAGAEREAG